MRRLVVTLGLLTCLPVFAAAAEKKPEKPAAVRGGAADDDEDEADDEEDDDILAPVRGEGDRPATVVPQKQKDLKVGLLTIVPLGDSGKTLGDQLTGELTKAFNESASVEVVALQMSTGAGVVSDASAAEAARKEGDDLLGKSKALLQKLQFGKAKKGYELTVAAYERAAAVLESPEPLIEAWLGLAEVAARQAQDDEVRRCLSIVAAYNPEKQLDKKRFPGLFITSHVKARDALLKGERVKIFVDESATGAKVFVDGRETSTAPARLTGLLPGHHLVRAVREGQPPWGAVVVVEGSETPVSPGFLAKDKKGPGEDLAQNKLSAEAAATVAEAARAQGLKGALVGAASKDAGRVTVQLVYVDAASGDVALLPPSQIQAALLDVGIESLKARSRLEELASAEKPELAPADADEALIEGARAGAGVQVTELAIKYDVKVSKDAPAAREVRGVEDEPGAEEDPDAERTVAEGKSGSRKRLDEEKESLLEQERRRRPRRRRAHHRPALVHAHRHRRRRDRRPRRPRRRRRRPRRWRRHPRPASRRGRAGQRHRADVGAGRRALTGVVFGAVAPAVDVVAVRHADDSASDSADDSADDSTATASALPPLLSRILPMRALTVLSLALPGALLGACTKYTPVNLAAVEPCGQENQALNGVQSFRVLSTGAEPDDVTAFKTTEPGGFAIGLGEQVVITVEGFADDITLGEDPTAPAVKPKSVGRTVPLAITESTSALNGTVLVGKVDAFGSPRTIEGNCSAMDTGETVPGRHGHTATYIPAVNKVLIYGGAVWVDDGNGGRAESFLRSAELYDPTTGFFEQLPDIKPPRAYHTATALPDGKVAIWGGFSTLGGETALVGTIQLVDVRVTDNPYLEQAGGVVLVDEPRAHHTATLLADANMLVAVGGCTGGPAAGCTTSSASGDSTSIVPAIEILNLGDLSSTTAGSALATPRAMHQAVAFPAGAAGVIAIVGGLNDSGPLRSVEILQVTGNSITSVAARADALGEPVVRHQAAVFDPTVPRKFIVTGGQNTAPGGVLSDAAAGTAVVSICSFVDAEITCAPDAPLQTTRYGHNMARLRDGTTFIVMGGVTPPVSASAEARRVNPGVGGVAWGPTAGALAESRERAAIALLGGDDHFINQIFLSGGHTAAKVTSNRTDIFFGP